MAFKSLVLFFSPVGFGLIFLVCCLLLIALFRRYRNERHARLAAESGNGVAVVFSGDPFYGPFYGGAAIGNVGGGTGGAVEIDDAQRSSDGIGNNNNNNDMMQQLSLQYRVELYKQAFDSNGNQITLQKSHFVTKKKSEGATVIEGSGTATTTNSDSETNPDVDVELGDDGN